MMQSDLSEKVKQSVEMIRKIRPDMMGKGDTYFLAFSGGKDSVVTKALLDMAGVKYEAHYRVTSVDPPELVRFIKDKHPDVSIDKPFYDGEVDKHGKPRQITMWNLIPRKLMPPTRIARCCCQYLKESSGDGRLTVTGVRHAESNNRKNNQGIITVMGNGLKPLDDSGDFTETKRGGLILTNDNADERRIVEHCQMRNKVTLNPIIYWTDRNVWDFIHAENIQYCGLYDDGFSRLGCVGCPHATKSGREREFLRWPKFKTAYLKAFDRMLTERDKRGKYRDRLFFNPQTVFNWWMEYDHIPGQMDLFEGE